MTGYRGQGIEAQVAQSSAQPTPPKANPVPSGPIKEKCVVDVPAFIPDDYVPDTGQRLEFYRRLAQARDEDVVRATLAELADRYGPLPDEATLLGEVMVDKTIVRALGALAYELAPTRLVLSFTPDAGLDPAKVTKLVSVRGSRFKLTPDMRLAYNFDEREKLDRMAAARARLQQLRGLVAA